VLAQPDTIASSKAITNPNASILLMNFFLPIGNKIPHSPARQQMLGAQPILQCLSPPHDLQIKKKIPIHHPNLTKRPTRMGRKIVDWTKSTKGCHASQKPSAVTLNHP
jgi:hypothetical protein